MMRSTRMKEAVCGMKMMLIAHGFTDAQYFVPEVESESESEASESAGVEVSQDILAGSGFDDVSVNEEIADEAENGPVYLSFVTSPPKRRNSTRAPTSVDPCSAGPDPWRRNIASDFADQFRHVESPVTSTASFADRHRAPPPPS